MDHTAHSPELNVSVITGGNHQRHLWVEGDPVNTTVMAIENESYTSIGITEHVGLLLVGTSHLVLEGHRSRCRMLLSQARDIPNSDATIQRGTDDEIFLRVELGAHGVMAMTGQGSN
jgi:hypothetical protein